MTSEGNGDYSDQFAVKRNFVKTVEQKLRWNRVLDALRPGQEHEETEKFTVKEIAKCEQFMIEDSRPLCTSCGNPFTPRAWNSKSCTRGCSLTRERKGARNYSKFGG